MNNVVNNQLLISSIIAEKPEYIKFSNYELSIEDGDAKVLNTNNVFNLGEISPKLICLKLIHNIYMMNAFLLNFCVDNHANFYNNSSKNKNLYLKIEISDVSVNILKRKGFGLFAYNVDDMAFCLYKFRDAILKYIKV